jgi:hypothetical protein
MKTCADESALSSGSSRRPAAASTHLPTPPAGQYRIWVRQKPDTTTVIVCPPDLKVRGSVGRETYRTGSSIRPQRVDVKMDAGEPLSSKE